ncbi:MAG: hypothetical protein Q4G71_02825 [Pseudomonadota bacterium]|nr:hypothetical protein [Pseudomonadota bacterium]
MNLSLFLASLSIAAVTPVLAVRYLQPILLRVLHQLCPADGAAAFWLRCCYLLALCGSLVLMLLLGNFDAGQSAVEVVRRTLLLVVGGVFFSVMFISRGVWAQVRRMQPAADSTAPLVLEGEAP